MSGPTPAKRRRIDATSILSKPFRSPLKTPTSATKTSKPIDRSTPIKKSLLSTTTSHANDLPPLTASEKNDPVLLAADAALKDLTSSIASIKAQIELLSQATSIFNRAGSTPHNSQPASAAVDKDTASRSVADLIQKWKSISQTAADTLYPTVEAKIAASGGLKAFYAQSKVSSYDKTVDGQGFEEGEDWESADLAMEEEAEVDFDENGNRVGEAEKGMRRDEVRRARERRRVQMGEGKDSKDGKEEEGEADGEEEFGMEVMLKSLHIEEKVIGWDRAEQRWV